jgi:hypothetical protein
MVVHDVLLSLVGFTGDIVECSIEDNQLRVCKNVKLDTYDRDIVDGLLELGSMYLKLREFIDNTERSTTASLYDLVIAKTIDSDILGPYEEVIARYEKMMASQLTLAGLRVDLWDTYYQGFQLLTDEVLPSSRTIDNISELLDKFRHPYITILCEALTQCFIQELISWCRYGVISGGPSRSRFFVKETDQPQLTGSRIDEISVFQIDRLRIPSRLVTMGTCDKVLFCGRAVIVLQNSKRSLSVFPDDFEAFSDNRRSETTAAADFIEREIEKMRLHLSRCLMGKLKNEVQPTLPKCLKAIRAVFLLADSTRWISFIEDPRSHQSPTEAFAQAFENLPSGVFAMTDDRIVSIDLPWPVDLVISPAAIEKYREIFGLLFRVVVASTRMRYCYSMQITNLFSSLQSYLQLQTVEGAYNVLMRVVETSDDIQEISQAHDTFLHKVYIGCLVGLDSIWSHIFRLFDLGDELARDRHMEPIVDKQVRAEMQLLIQGLLDLQDRPNYKSVEKLLLSLDFNNFYRSGN